MRTVTDLDSFYSAWGDYWGALRYDFFKLETLQFYDVEEEMSARLAFERGDREEAERQLRTFLMGSPPRNVQMRRVHVVDLPLSTYVQFELLAYKISAETGEESFLLPRDTATTLALPIKLQDFLLFDEKVVMRHSFTNGKWISTDILEEPAQVEAYVTAKNMLLEHSLPYQKFTGDQELAGK
jgi:hypothetical protein